MSPGEVAKVVGLAVLNAIPATALSTVTFLGNEMILDKEHLGLIAQIGGLIVLIFTLGFAFTKLFTRPVAQQEARTAADRAIESAKAAIDSHALSLGSHYEAISEHIQPLVDEQAKLRDIIIAMDKKLDALIVEHSVIRQNECRILEARSRRTRITDPPDATPKDFSREE